MGNDSSSGHVWKPLTIVIVLMVMSVLGYTLLTGGAVKRMNIPGFEVEFADSKGGIVSGNKVEEMGAGEVKSRQAELEAKLKELQTRLDAKSEAPTFVSEMGRASAPATQIEERRVQTYNLSGTWNPPADDPSFYTIEQNGNSLVIQQSVPNLGVLAAGQGQLSGRTITISYTTVLGTTGRGTATVSADGSQITGQVTDLTTGVVSPLIISRGSQAQE